MNMIEAVNEAKKQWFWHHEMLIGRIVEEEQGCYFPATSVRTLSTIRPDLTNECDLSQPDNNSIDIHLQNLIIKQKDVISLDEESKGRLIWEVGALFITKFINEIYKPSDKIYLVRHGDNEFGHIQREDYRKYYFKFGDAYYEFLKLYETLCSYKSRLKDSSIRHQNRSFSVTNGVILLEIAELKCN